MKRKPIIVGFTGFVFRSCGSRRVRWREDGNGVPSSGKLSVNTDGFERRDQTARSVLRTEVVDDASWVMGLIDVIDPTLENIKRPLNLGKNSDGTKQEVLKNIIETSNDADEEPASPSTSLIDGNIKENKENEAAYISDFDVDAFVRDKLSLDASKLDAQMETFDPEKIRSSRKIWRSENRTVMVFPRD